MARYYCTCKKGARTPHDYAHTQYHETEVDKEGVCTYCGYYAFTRASIEHELFPRHGRKVTALYVYKNINRWNNPELYNQFFKGHGSGKQGLSYNSLNNDREKISNEREKELERTNGNRG